MRRRDFVMLAACGALLRQRAARAQSVRVIGFLRSTSAVSSANLVASFRQGLTEQGFVEGQELVIQYAFADGEPNRLPDRDRGASRDATPPTPPGIGVPTSAVRELALTRTEQ